MTQHDGCRFSCTVTDWMMKVACRPRCSLPAGHVAISKQATVHACNAGVVVDLNGRLIELHCIVPKLT